MIKINLIPYRAERKKGVIREHAIIACLVCIPFILGIAFSYFLINLEISQLSEKIVKTDEEIKKQAVSLEKINTFKVKKEALVQKMGIITSLQKGRSGPVHVLDNLASNLPGKLWLTSLKETGMKLEISGYALDNQSISNYMVNLEKSPYFKNVDLVKINTEEKSRAKGARLKNFTLISQISYQEGS